MCNLWKKGRRGKFLEGRGGLRQRPAYIRIFAGSPFGQPASLIVGVVSVMADLLLALVGDYSQE